MLKKSPETGNGFPVGASSFLRKRSSTVPAHAGTATGQARGPVPTKPTPPTPLSGLLKKPHRGSAPNFTPPLRVGLPEGKARRRGRAVCAKADSVGGKTFLIAIPNSTPHRFACGLTPLSHRLPLKGGVKFKSTRATKIVLGGFFNNLLVNGPHSRTAPARGEKGGPGNRIPPHTSVPSFRIERYAS